MGQRRLKTYLAAAALCLVAFGIYCGVQAARPDRVLSFTREVPSSVPLETLNLSISSIANWPQWFFTAGKAERIDISGQRLATAEQKVVTGALIRLEILPHKGEHRGSFDLMLQIGEYVPGRLLVINLARDQAGRITKLFEHVQWKIELLPGGPGGPPVLIRGTETARTRHWRARLLAALSDRILLNQIFYPDLMALGHFTQPLPPNPFPAYGQ